ncbi:MAG TPA: DUF411 domain-containing protein [Burkholderiaceae bacterium]
MKRVQQFRRRLMAAAAALAVAPVASKAFAQAVPLVEVWKTPSCGCCKDWIRHMEANGFRIKAHDVDSTSPVRSRMGLPDTYASCHTATIGGYAIEGHVPANDIKRLLREKPDAVGLAVPGMVVGSPGMDTPAYGGRKDPYQVMLVGRDGRARVYQSYR